MKLTPIASPLQVTQVQPDAKAAAATRERAISMITGTQEAKPAQQAQQSPVGNPTKVAPEELSAIVPIDNRTQEEVLSDANPPPTGAETKPEEPVSNQLALIARREKALRARALQQDQTLKQREAALQAKEAEVQKQLEQYKTGYIPKEQLKTQTLKMLEDAGVSYDDLTQQILSKGSIDPYTQATIQELKSQIKELMAANDATKQEFKSREDQSYQAAVQQIKSDAAKLVQRDPAYEMIKATGRVGAVVKLIEDVYAKDQIVMSVEDAAEQVENELLTRYERIARTNKLQQRLRAASARPQSASPASKQGVPKQQQPMKTLTNAAATSRQLSARERAIRVFKGEPLS